MQMMLVKWFLDYSIMKKSKIFFTTYNISIIIIFLYVIKYVILCHYKMKMYENTYYCEMISTYLDFYCISKLQKYLDCPRQIIFPLESYPQIREVVRRGPWPTQYFCLASKFQDKLLLTPPYPDLESCFGAQNNPKFRGKKPRLEKFSPKFRGKASP